MTIAERLQAARADHNEWHNKFLCHVRGCDFCRSVSPSLCDVAQLYDARADAAGRRWAILEGVEL